MGIFRRPNEREQRRAWKIARSAWLESGGDVQKARKLVKPKIQQEFGSIIVFVTVAAAIVSICYNLFQIWNELRCSEPPEQVMRTGDYSKVW